MAVSGGGMNIVLLNEKIIFALKDIDGKFDGFAIERLFAPSDIATLVETEPKEIKKDIKRYKKALAGKIQELLASNQKANLSAETIKNFDAILSFLSAKFNSVQSTAKKVA